MNRAPLYLLIAIGMTWPTAIRPVTSVPGSPNGDLWEGLWSLWFFAHRVADGLSPFSVAGLLNHPDGGSLWVADPLNSLLGLPLVLTVGPAAAWSVLVLGHLVFSALTADRLAEALGGNGLVAGTLYAFAPIAMCHLHNGATEAVGTGWLALTALMLVRRRPVAAGLALALTTVGSWYYGVCGFLLVAVMLLVERERRLLLTPVLALLLAAPVALVAARLSRAPDNVVGIKSDRELATIRRTIGAADPVAFVHPGDFRSPDFRRISRYGEDYVHSPYLGLVALLVACLGARRTPATWWIAGLLAAVLAMGPVVAQQGGPLILPGRRAIPLPYLLIDSLPGFSGLSLVWRLSQLSALCVAVLASRGAGRAGPIVALLALLETRIASPAAALPGHTDTTPDPALRALRDAPEGAVMLWPVVGGRPYLFEQVTHGKPIVGTLNFPNNSVGRRLWKRLPDPVAAKAAGVRWLIVHDDPAAGPDPTDVVVRALGREPAFATGDHLRIYALW